MTEERRYSGSEIERIFEHAVARADAGRRMAPDAGGLTLAELQDIGREVGIPPERVASAAMALEQGGVRRVGGLPLRVSVTTPLPRAPTDAEWHHLVAELRETFAARGRVEVEGGYRQWRNGNLFVAVEPLPEGTRLRMGTTRGQARPLLVGGAISLGVGSLFMGLSALGIMGGEDVFMGALLSAVGIGQVGFATLPLPAWAARRHRQMQDIAARLTNRLAGAPARTHEDARLPEGGTEAPGSTSRA